MLRFAAVLAATLVATGTAAAAWTATAGGSGGARATTIGAGSTPSASVPVLSSNVSVSWTAATYGNGTAVGGYVVRRFDTGGAAQTVKAGCAGTVQATACTENGVPPGVWTYSVTPAAGAWRGTESGRSSSVVVPGV